LRDCSPLGVMSAASDDDQRDQHEGFEGPICLRVLIRDAGKTEATIQTLMGGDVAPRFEFIMERGPKVEEVDV